MDIPTFTKLTRKERINLKLQINKDYRVETDSYCFILQERKQYKDSPRLKDKEKVGEDYWTNIGFYGNTRHLYSSLIDRKIRTSDLTNWKDLNKMLDDFLAEIKSVYLSEFNEHWRD